MVATLAATRAGAEQVMPSLEAFGHDCAADSTKTSRRVLDVALRLRGVRVKGEGPMSVKAQVDMLVAECTDDNRLRKMFVGWMPWV
jgi:phosphatidylinositol kinase/protein kinase (PI-3  family)